jgi:hypothetical protein
MLGSVLKGPSLRPLPIFSLQLSIDSVLMPLFSTLYSCAVGPASLTMSEKQNSIISKFKIIYIVGIKTNSVVNIALLNKTNQSTDVKFFMG